MDKYFKVLNVNKDMSLSEIKTAYRKLLKKYHPDTYLGDKSFAEKKTIEINEAYREVVKFKNKNQSTFNNANQSSNETQKQANSQENRKQEKSSVNEKKDYSNFKEKAKNSSSFNFKNFVKENKRTKQNAKEPSIFDLKNKKVENSAERIDEFIKSDEEIRVEKKGKRILDAIIVSLSVITIGLILLFIFMGKSF